MSPCRSGTNKNWLFLSSLLQWSNTYNSTCTLQSQTRLSILLRSNPTFVRRWSLKPRPWSPLSFGTFMSWCNIFTSVRRTLESTLTVDIVYRFWSGVRKGQELILVWTGGPSESLSPTPPRLYHHLLSLPESVTGPLLRLTFWVSVS